jgi:hypothetical protein
MNVFGAKQLTKTFLPGLIVFILIPLSSLRSQVALYQRDQRSWLMQFAGTWRAVAGVDTEAVWQAIPIAHEKALQVHSSTTAKGQLIRESWGIWAFDAENDRISCTTLVSTGSIIHATGTFVKRSILRLTMGFVPLRADQVTTTSLELSNACTFEAYQTDPGSGTTKPYVFNRAEQ